jgi:hypothetical protein
VKEVPCFDLVSVDGYSRNKSTRVQSSPEHKAKDAVSVLVAQSVLANPPALRSL